MRDLRIELEVLGCPEYAEPLVRLWEAYSDAPIGYDDFICFMYKEDAFSDEIDKDMIREKAETIRTITGGYEMITMDVKDFIQVLMNSGVKLKIDILEEELKNEEG